MVDSFVENGCTCHCEMLSFWFHGLTGPYKNPSWGEGPLALYCVKATCHQCDLALKVLTIVNEAKVKFSMSLY